MESLRRFIAESQNPYWELGEINYYGGSYSFDVEKLDWFKQRYFADTPKIVDFQCIIPEETDFNDLVFLLRVHYNLWIEIFPTKWISLSVEFPRRFELIKDFKKEEGFVFIKAGTALYYFEELNIETNRLEGLKLSLEEKLDESDRAKTHIIGYEYIEPKLDNFNLYI